MGIMYVKLLIGDHYNQLMESSILLNLFRFIYQLEPGQYIIVFSAAPKKRNDPNTKFLLRACAHGITEFGHLI